MPARRRSSFGPPRSLRVRRAILRVALGSLVGLLGIPSIDASSLADGGMSGLWRAATASRRSQDLTPALELERSRSLALDHVRMARALAHAPHEAARPDPADLLELSLPTPDGRFERFAIQESPVMEPGLAVLHPEIRTYVGEGVSDPTATIRISLTPLGFQASIRGAEGAWYIDPYYHRSRALYASYFAGDLVNVHGPLVEPEEAARELRAHVHSAEEEDAATALASSGEELRVYRLALTSDPGYARHFGAENVTAAKVALINRVTQIYEDETAIRMILVANNDLLNLNTTALATGANGPCGAAPCFTSMTSCGSALLNRNRIVIGQLIGASNYDIGHVILGAGGGGIAGLGVVGGDGKARGCTGVVPPVGDFFAVDYVAHEMGHQFGGNHTFNGTNGSCAATNRNGPNSVEPGSGSSIMAYAGICLTDDLQAHSDPYWSQRSHQEITTYVRSSRSAINEVQTASFTGFDGSDSFRVTYEGRTSSPVTRGVNYDVNGIDQAVESVLPEGGTAAVLGFAAAAAPDDTGFQVTIGGSVAGENLSSLGLERTGFAGFFGETAKGGPIDNKGHQVLPTENSPPTVSAPVAFIIPYQTPFALTGQASDPDGDALTYLWEQNDPGVTPDLLFNPVKTNGPLFRQFGVGQDASLYNGQIYNSPGENHPTGDPTRVFPDMAQILANNTNAETGTCQASNVDCFSEFLPTPAYAGPMHFRLTVRDHRPGGGGIASTDTLVTLAPGTGPFRILAPNSSADVPGGSTQTVLWSVAGTSLPPIGTANVEILLSTDGGLTFPTVLAASTANDGVEEVTIPNVKTSKARILVRALGNVFFDVSNENFAIQ